MKSKQEKKTSSRKNRSLRIKVLGLSGKTVSSITVTKEIFGLKLKLAPISQYERVYLANQRHVSTAVKTRGEVKGSTKKIYRQKGTGRARHGDRKAPIFVGGGIAHGPKKRGYKRMMNKKQKKQILFQALSFQFSQNNIFALSNEFINLEAKTKKFALFLEKANLINEKILLVLDFKKDKNLYRAGKNLANVVISQPEMINPYLVLQADKLLFISHSLEKLEKNEN